MKPRNPNPVTLSLNSTLKPDFNEYGNEIHPGPLCSFVSGDAPANPLKLVIKRRINLLDSWNPCIPRRIAKSAAGSVNLVGDIYDVHLRRKIEEGQDCAWALYLVYNSRMRSVFSFFHRCAIISPLPFLFTALVRSLICESWTNSCPSLFRYGTRTKFIAFSSKRGRGLDTQSPWTSALL